MSARNGRTHRPPDGANGEDVSPSRVSAWSPVARTIREQGRTAGFEAARDKCFEDFELLSQRVAPYAVLKLAIEFDKHALYADLVATKERGKEDASAWDAYQRYLSGAVDVVPMPGVAPAQRVRIGQVSAEVDDDEAAGPGPAEER